MDENRRRSPRTGRHGGVPGYRSPEKSLDRILQLEQQRTAQRAEALSWLNDIFRIR